MITKVQEEWILTRAYIPEHIVSLMTLISQGEPFLLDDCLVLARDNWVILVGYPLPGRKDIPRLERVAGELAKRHRLEYLWVMAPAMPDAIMAQATERESDWYYILDLENLNIKPSLQGKARRAAGQLTIEQGRVFSKDHEALVEEFFTTVELPPKIRALYLAMPSYVSQSTSSLVLGARDKQGCLSAFYVLDLAARDFTTYLLGCYSRKNYVSYASDLLFHEMIKVSREHKKKTINLGLGVNDGIRRFKVKWGGLPTVPYNFCECRFSQAQTNIFHRYWKGLLGLAALSGGVGKN